MRAAPLSWLFCLLSALPLALPAAETPLPPAWLSGTWVSDQPEMRVEERWSAVHNGLMLGSSRTDIGGKRAFFEFLRIETRDDGLYYVAQPNGGAATAFKLVESKQHELLFENAAHDFPQRIRYRLDADGSLHASIEGDVGGKPRQEAWHYRRQP